MVLIRVLATLLVLQLSYAQKSSELVIGGGECDRNEHPFLVTLYTAKSKKVYCTGTLISPEWVLTAARCDRKTMQIKIGMHSKTETNEDEKMRLPREKFFCLPSKTYTRWDKDIMLIRLNSPVNDSTHIAPLSLPTSPPSVGSVCRIMGWGTITTDKVTYPDVLQCANIEIFDYSVCRKAYRKLPEKSKTLCAGILEGGIDSCHVDNGGPLICNGEFQGILSWGGRPCAQPHKPSLYTNVFEHIDWIQNIIAGNLAATCPP